MNAPNLDDNLDPIEAINAIMVDVKDSQLDEATMKVIAFALEQGGLEIQCIDKKLIVDSGAESLLEYQFPGCDWKFRSLLGRLCEVSREAPRESFLGNTNGFTADVALLKGMDTVFRIQTKNIAEEQLYLLVQRIDYEEGEEEIPAEVEGGGDIVENPETAYANDTGGEASGG